MEAFVITLREGLEAALVIGLVLAYLDRTGRSALRRWVYVGLGLAVVASLLGALVFQLAGFDPENEILEGTLLAIAAGLVLSLVVWMWRTSRHLKREIEDQLAALTAPATQERRQGWGLLAFVFFMVLREGVEMILFLAALSLAKNPDLTGLVGGLAGLALAVLFGVLFVKGSLRINLQRFFAVTSLVLLVLAVRLVAGSLHEFFEIHLLPSTPAVLSVIGFIVKDATSTAVLIALVALPVLSLLPELRLRPEAVALRPEETAAERRKRLARIYRARKWQFVLVSATLTIVLPLGGATYALGQSVYRPEPLPVSVAPDGMVHIPVSALDQHQLHLYSYHASQADMTFMVIKREEGDYAVALNACSICPARGYHQDGDMLACENCNAPINMETVGMPGGCNPIPLEATLVAGEIRLAASTLDARQAVFAK
jgi:high-affinity iron transporter